MSTFPAIYVPPRPRILTAADYARQKIQQAGNAALDRAKRFRSSLGTLFSQGRFVNNGGRVVNASGQIVGDTADCPTCPCGSGSSGACDCGATSSGNVLAVFSGYPSGSIPDGFSICLNGFICTFTGSETYTDPDTGDIITVSLNVNLSSGGSPSYSMDQSDEFGSICASSGTITCDVGGGATITTGGGLSPLCDGTITLIPGGC